MQHPICSEVDPFIGCAATELPPVEGMAATWWWPKPQVGNTHPGACFPFGMVSACPYSGAYPTGYGLYQKNTEGIPRKLYETYRASGFTHFQQSGTGAIRKYYNYFRVTPLMGPLQTLGNHWELCDERAEPGYYAAQLSETGITAELTVAEKVAVHRYTFSQGGEASIAIDFSCGGLALEHGRTLPMRADLETLGPGHAQGTVVMEGVALSVHIETDHPGLRPGLWYDRQLVGGGKRLVFDYIRETTLRSFGIVFFGKLRAGETVTIKLAFSLRGVERAKANAEAVRGQGFDQVRQRTASVWEEHLGRVRVSGGSATTRKVFYTALYHSMLKPCFAEDESPFWPTGGPFVFDVCTMWDIYKTQLPLMTVLAPKRITELLIALTRVCEEEGNYPIGYRMARGADRFYRQASALAHASLADVNALELPGIDWEWVLGLMTRDLLRTYGEEFAEKGVVHPLTHTLDLAYGYYCTARVARSLGDLELAKRLDGHATAWVAAYDPETGLLADSTYYEGTKYNYSFRLLHDMAKRIQLSGGDEAFVRQLDRFFGYGAEPVRQLGVAPSAEELSAGYALGRFEGLNNEPDMEAPFAYYYAGRPDRSAEVVGAILRYMFAEGRGGLAGNDDSGGISSWYVWAALGLFPVAGQSIYLIGVPTFERVELNVAGKSFVIDTRNRSENQNYVSQVILNGEQLMRSYLTGAELFEGGHMVVHLSPMPNDWGSDHRPPSYAGI